MFAQAVRPVDEMCITTVGQAFASGNMVKGTLHLTVCPWDCTDEVVFPFAVRVP